MQQLDRDSDLERVCAELASYQAAIDHHAAVAVTDPAGKVIRVNDLFCQISGYARAELVGQDHRILQSGHHPREFWADLWHTITHGGVWHGEICNRAKDGTLFWTDTSVVPLRDADDHIVQYMDIRSDLTDCKRVQADLAAGRRAAEAENDQKCQLLAQATQALRMPLTTVVGYVELLHDSTASGEVSTAAIEYVETLRRAGPSLLALLNDLSDLARIGGKAFTPAPSLLDAAVLAGEVIASLRAPARDRNVKVRLQSQTAPYEACTDSARVQQILTHLVERAIARTPQGTVTVVLHAPSGIESGAAGLHVEVCDDGVALAGEALAQVFAPPERPEASLDGGACSPLGLCLSRRLAEALGGTLTARGEAGVGNVFTLILPPLQADETAVAEAPRPAAPAPSSGGLVDAPSPARPAPVVPYAAIRSESEANRQRVLVVDDAPVVHGLVERHLRDFGVIVQHADGGLEALELAARDVPDLVLLDYDMAGIDGLETIRRMRGDERLESVPVIFVTGSNDAAVEVQAFRHGAVDFLRKPFQPAVLRARVRAALQTRALRALLEREALHDRLTGLPNRALIQGRIGDAVAMKRADPSRNYALLFLDFDRFKNLNDTLGHEAGDELLRQIAQRMRSVTRATDHVMPGTPQPITARLGGDEFVVLLEGLGAPQDAVKVAERLLERLSDEFEIRGTHVVSTASIGIVLGDESYGSAVEVLRDADAAMYEAKAAGRGRCVVFDSTMRARVADRVQLERDLRVALDREELSLVYQPIVCLRSGQLEGIEALLRWTHPHRGRIPPSDFVLLAEETGLIAAIGEWALERACRDFVQLRRVMGARAPRSVSVNVSRQQLGSPDFVCHVQSVLEQCGLAPHSLKLEVTENGIMRDPEQAVRVLRALKSLGVGLHVDDFGTGSSSLACLHQFPVDTLKVDRSFVANSGETPGIAALLLAIVQMARTLGIHVVAEGIETPEQLLLLQSIDCQFGQGYLLGRPMPADAVASYHRETPPALVVPDAVAEARLSA